MAVTFRDGQIGFETTTCDDMNKLKVTQGLAELSVEHEWCNRVWIELEPTAVVLRVAMGADFTGKVTLSLLHRASASNASAVLDKASLVWMKKLAPEVYDFPVGGANIPVSTPAYGFEQVLRYFPSAPVQFKLMWDSAHASTIELPTSISWDDDGKQLQVVLCSQVPSTVQFVGIPSFQGTIHVTWKAEWKIGTVEYVYSMQQLLRVYAIDDVYSPRAAPPSYEHVVVQDVTDETVSATFSSPGKAADKWMVDTNAGQIVDAATRSEMEEFIVVVESLASSNSYPRRRLESSVALPSRVIPVVTFFNESVFTYRTAEWVESCQAMIDSMVDPTSFTIALDWTNAVTSIQNVFISSQQTNANEDFDWLSGTWNSTDPANAAISVMLNEDAGSVLFKLDGSFRLFNGSTYFQSSIVHFIPPGISDDGIDVLSSVDSQIVTQTVSRPVQNGTIQLTSGEFLVAGSFTPPVLSELQFFASSAIQTVLLNESAYPVQNNVSLTWCNISSSTIISVVLQDPTKDALKLRFVVRLFSSGSVVVTEVATYQVRCLSRVPSITYPSAILAQSMSSTCATQLLLPTFEVDDSVLLDVSVQLYPCSDLLLEWRGKRVLSSTDSCTYNLVSASNSSFSYESIVFVVQNTSANASISFQIDAVTSTDGLVTSHVELNWFDVNNACVQTSGIQVLPPCIVDDNALHPIVFQTDLTGQDASEFYVSKGGAPWSNHIAIAIVPCGPFDVVADGANDVLVSSFSYNPMFCHGTVVADAVDVRFVVKPLYAFYGSFDVVFTRVQTLPTAHTVPSAAGGWLNSTCQYSVTKRVSWRPIDDANSPALSSAQLLSIPFNLSQVQIDFNYLITSEHATLTADVKTVTNSSLLLHWSSDIDPDVAVGEWQAKRLDFSAQSWTGPFQLVLSATTYFDDEVSLQSITFSPMDANDVAGALVLESVTGGSLTLSHQLYDGVDHEEIVDYTVYLGQENQTEERIAYSGRGVVSTGCAVSSSFTLASADLMAPSVCASHCFNSEAQGRLTATSVLRSLATFNLPVWTLDIRLSISNSTPSNSLVFMYGVQSVAVTFFPTGLSIELCAVRQDFRFALPTNKWMRLAFAWNAYTKTLAVYLNGLVVAEAVASQSCIVSAVGYIQIGGGNEFADIEFAISHQLVDSMYALGYQRLEGMVDEVCVSS
ncbi:hypothetical protein DYB32_002506 [Aphanomyces invadans]|uniref:Uncharacterized protein n=1 Tax=Aphanomyces invadans TaxID=157072 RepID=A0A418B385_9STRA|nr:hypothetical protein DYB32_002506 [Aphanomyces invadans]